MSELSQFYDSLSGKGKEWIEANIETLDSSITDFCLSAVDSLKYDDLDLVVRLMCSKYFCGLDEQDVYNTIAHDETRTEEISHIDLYNQEMADWAGNPSATVKGKMSYLFGFDPLIHCYANDSGIQWDCMLSLDSYYSKSRHRIKQLNNRPKIGALLYPAVECGPPTLLDFIGCPNLWVAVTPSSGAKFPSSWKMGSLPSGGIISAVPFQHVTKTGTIKIGPVTKAQEPLELNSYDEFIYVPVQQIDSWSIRDSCRVHTLLDEKIIDHYNLPKAE